MSEETTSKEDFLAGAAFAAGVLIIIVAYKLTKKGFRTVALKARSIKKA